MMIVKLASAMRRAKSLSSIHLCGNKGVTERVKEFIRIKIRAMPAEIHTRFKIS